MIVLDTNVLVSALVARQTGSPPQVLLEAAIRRRFPLLLSATLVDEYRAVLNRERHQRRHGLDATRIDRLIQGLVDRGNLIAPSQARAICPDPADAFLWALLDAERASTLVTGERALLESSDFPGRILRPRDAMVRLGLVPTQP